MKFQNTDCVEILLVEDNPGDVVLIKEALRDAKVKNHLNVTKDGIEAMDFLLKKGDYKNVDEPGLVLLDLNLPKKDGRQVLSEIKGNKDLRHIPVVIMTTSEDEQDVVKAYDLQANCYITKPVDFEQFMKVIHSIEEFWLTLVKLPQK